METVQNVLSPFVEVNVDEEKTNDRKCYSWTVFYAGLNYSWRCAFDYCLFSHIGNSGYS